MTGHGWFGQLEVLKISVHFRNDSKPHWRRRRATSFGKVHLSMNPCSTSNFCHLMRFPWWWHHYRTAWRRRQQISQRLLFLLNWLHSSGETQDTWLAWTLLSLLGVSKNKSPPLYEIRKSLSGIRAVPIPYKVQHLQSCSFHLLYIPLRGSCPQALHVSQLHLINSSDSINNYIPGE